MYNTSVVLLSFHRKQLQKVNFKNSWLVKLERKKKNKIRWKYVFFFFSSEFDVKSIECFFFIKIISINFSINIYKFFILFRSYSKASFRRNSRVYIYFDWLFAKRNNLYRNGKTTKNDGPRLETLTFRYDGLTTDELFINNISILIPTVVRARAR